MKFELEKFRSKAKRPILALMVLFVAGTTFLVDMPEYLNGVQSSNWQSKEGTLEARDVSVLDVGSSKALQMKFKYRYVVSNRLYFGNRLRFQQPKLFDGIQISNLEKKYKVGDKVKVFYEPNNPANSCLEPGGHISLVLSHLVIYIILALIIYFSIYPKLEKVKSIKQEEIKVESTT